MSADPRYIAALIVAGMLALAVWCDGEDERPPAPAYQPQCPGDVEYTPWCGCDPPAYGDDC